MSKRVLAMALAILAFFIFIGSPFGETARAVVGVDNAVLLIILAALASMGITFSMTGGIRTVLDWLDDQIQDAGLDFSQVRYGANNQGQLLLNNRFLIMVSTLALYIQNELGLTDNETITISEQGTIAGTVYAYRLPFEVTSNDGSRYVIISSSPDAYVFFNYTNAQHSRIRPVAFAYGDATFYYMRYNSFGDASSTYTSNQVNGGNYVWDPNYISIESGSGSGYEDAFAGVIIHSYELSSSNVGTWLEQNVFGTGVDTTQGLSISAGVLDIPTGEDIVGKGGILTLPVPWGETLPGAIQQIPGLTLTDELAGNVDLDIENEADVADQISETATNVPTVSDIPEDYQTPGLQSVFPFCIPFDIYAFFECLAADPEAPSFTWRFYIPGICDEDIEIDLAAFDSAARILRTMELLLFIVGLAFVTRDKFLRG